MEQRPSSVNRMKPDAFPAQGVPVFTAITASETAVTWSASVDTGSTSSDTNPCNGIIRWYDPITGRWLSNDPIGISGGLNQYVFCDNNPINRRDPSGLDNIPWDFGMTGYGSPDAFISSSANPYGGAMTPSGTLDVNISGGSGGGGFTGGVQINWSGVYPYFGGGWMSPGFGGAVSYSPSAPSVGYNLAIQGQYGIAGQFGYGFGNNGGLSWAAGIGWPPGISFTGFNVWGPFLSPAYLSIPQSSSTPKKTCP